MNKEKIAYNFNTIEKKWIKKWDYKKLYEAKIDKSKSKFYILDTFVYPSGKGVTVGHFKSFGGMDVMARYKRMKGFNVIYPTGWDTFGLPAENFAIKSGIHPKDHTAENIKNYIRQFKAAGLSYDWSREINTADPDYYKWTQWLFLILYNKGLAYRKLSKVNWCNTCKTVIAKEQIIDGGICERCHNPVVEKELIQWFFKVTDYADRLMKDISKLYWKEKYINPHKKWIEKDHLHDWCISRQRYWGPPIPIIYCERCGEVPVPEDQLPVKLPYDVDYTPTGESPLSKNPEFVNTKCPKCGGEAKRETDTMDTFVSSAWYQFRFTDPNNTKEFAGKEVLNYWNNVDQYSGTIEHLTAHLVYARFITKVLYDEGYLPFDEPFPKFTPVGLLVDKTGTKFSKRLGNAPDTDLLIEKFGGDALRLSCFFITPYEDISKWSEQDVVGIQKFRDRIWRVFDEKVDRQAHEMPENYVIAINKLVKSVTVLIESLSYNVAISKMMIFLKKLNNYDGMVDIDVWKNFTKVLAPFAPFITEEMWYRMKNATSIHKETWPIADEKYIKDDTVNIAIQVNGKTKGTITVDKGSSEEEVKEAVYNSDLNGKIPSKVKIIYVVDKVINFQEI